MHSGQSRDGPGGGGVRHGGGRGAGGGRSVCGAAHGRSDRRYCEQSKENSFHAPTPQPTGPTHSHILHHPTPASLLAATLATAAGPTLCRAGGRGGAGGLRSSGRRQHRGPAGTAYKQEGQATSKVVRLRHSQHGGASDPGVRGDDGGDTSEAGRQTSGRASTSRALPAFNAVAGPGGVRRGSGAHQVLPLSGHQLGDRSSPRRELATNAGGRGRGGRGPPLGTCGGSGRAHSWGEMRETAEGTHSPAGTGEVHPAGGGHHGATGAGQQAGGILERRPLQHPVGGGMALAELGPGGTRVQRGGHQIPRPAQPCVRTLRWEGTQELPPPGGRPRPQHHERPHGQVVGRAT